MNIFQIEQSLIDIFDTIEKNGGELTPELEEQLAITQDSFVDKCKSYADVIKSIDMDLAAIKCEEARLNKIKNSKKKTRERIVDIIAKAITMFGDTTKSGGKFIDFGTGKINVRNSTITNVDSTKQSFLEGAIEYHLKNDFYYAPVKSILNSYYEHRKSLLEKVNEQLTTEYKELDTDVIPNEKDCENITVTIEANIPLNDVIDLETVKSIARNYNIKCSVNVDKNEMKTALLQGGSSNLCSIEEKQSITIK